MSAHRHPMFAGGRVTSLAILLGLAALADVRSAGAQSLRSFNVSREEFDNVDRALPVCALGRIGRLFDTKNRRDARIAREKTVLRNAMTRHAHAGCAR